MESLQTNFSLVQDSNRKMNGMGDDGSPPMKNDDRHSRKWENDDKQDANSEEGTLG